MIAVIDGDNFFASVEQLLNPELRKLPLVVLSANDGNVISRSKQAKILGIKMGQPRHELTPFLKTGLLAVQSANFPTYEIMSQRLDWAVSHFAPITEPYSCDELFADLFSIDAQEIAEYAKTIRREVTRLTGLPVSLGVSKSKTLCKVAIEIAKKSDGVHVLATAAAIDEALTALPVGEIWMVGDRKATWLRKQGITTAAALRDAPLGWVRQHLSVITARTVLELRGTPAFPIQTERATAHEVMISKAFSHPVTDLATLREALNAYGARACEKMRALGMQARSLTVWVGTNPFRKKLPQYHNSLSLHLDRPTDYTPAILERASEALMRLYRPYPFHRVGLRLSDLVPGDLDQGTLYAPHFPSAKERALMLTIDAICQRFGREAIRFLGSGLARPWASKAGYRTPRALTRWNEIPRAYVE